MKYSPRKRKGAALITVIALIVVTSLMVAAVYYFLKRGVEVSGLQKKYQTAREASLGGLDVLTKEILPIAISGTNLSSLISTQFSAITSAQVVQGATDACFSTKLLQKTANWGGCSSTLDAKTSPDITFVLSGATPSQSYNVYTKIVDTVQGN